ncbi:MAG: AAA family ATPase [Cyanobacteriota bacterium]|nr:AAA family ATPase [Cyanobacteriota bacterium]
MTNIALPKFIAPMLQPEFYPHSVTEPIKLIQTHISFVLLTGEYVYKIKKSVDFGFLDYSTLEKRQHFCQQELVMNQRGAPGIYLEVLPILQDGDRFILGTRKDRNGEIIEYTLKMRQFSQQDLWLHQFEQGNLTVGDLEEFGRILAQFHQNAVTNEYIRSFGKVDRIRMAIENNYRATQKYIGTLQDKTQFEETKDYTDRFFQTYKPVFDRRIQTEKIRECHGDLHLNNIARWQGKIILFDCIEFNEPFRFVDVMYDVGFTVMDLEMRQRRDLANAFLNTYLEETGDWEGAQLLPLYRLRQAYVRAKVNSFLSDDRAISSAERDRAARTASEYYRLAWEYTQPSRGQLILMSGLSGSGKSTVARQLARRLGAVCIRSDAVRKHLAGIDLYQRGGDDLYTEAMNQRTYQRSIDLGETLATRGWSVILDAKFDRTRWREAAIAMARSHQLPLHILSCTAPLAVLRDRLNCRTGDITDATADLLASQQAAAEPFSPTEQNYVTTLDTTAALAPQLESIVRLTARRSTRRM